jgi:hypothetical protein
MDPNVVTKKPKFITLHSGHRVFSGNLDYIHTSTVNLSGTNLMNYLKSTKIIMDNIDGYKNEDSPKHYLNEVLKINKNVNDVFPNQIELNQIFLESEKNGFGERPKWYQVLMFLKHSSIQNTLVFHY